MVVGCQPYAPAAFTSRKYSWYSFLLEAESIPGPQSDRKDFLSMKNPLTSAGIEPAIFRFAAQHLNHCATTVPITAKVAINNLIKLEFWLGIIIIIIIIRHDLGLDRPVSAPSYVFQVVFVHFAYNSALFLASFCCSFLFTCHSQFYLYLRFFSSASSTFNSSRIS